MSSRLRIDLSGLVPALGNDALEARRDAARAAHAAILARRESGEIGFFDLASSRAHLDECERIDYRDCDRLVVLGMGGSSLGAQALTCALAPAALRRIVFVDNSDPDTLARLLQSGPFDRTIWNAVTKSGGTSETCAQLLAIASVLERELGREEALRRIVVTTDPLRGALRALATELKLATLTVPENVGGRFSVLSSVGLFPALVAGIDVPDLLEGAARMSARITDHSDPFENPALMLAVLAVSHLEAGRPIHVFWAYADALERTGAWFGQLWGESLGKIDGHGVGVGPTPLCARGATDQHSMLQLFAEGPDDKIHLFVTPTERTVLPLAGSTALGAGAGFDYLVGRSMGELIDAQLEGTRGSLARRARPSALFALDSLNAGALGELIMLLEGATAFAGPLLGVDPFDQPGVEEAKVLAFAALGRPGYTTADKDPMKSDPRYVF